MMEFNSKKGTMAVIFNEDEREMLFDSGQEFRILDVKDNKHFKNDHGRIDFVRYVYIEAIDG